MSSDPETTGKMLIFVLAVLSLSMILNSEYNIKDVGVVTPQNIHISLKTFLVRVSRGQIDSK